MNNRGGCEVFLIIIRNADGARHPARTRRERLRCTPRLSESDPPASPEAKPMAGRWRAGPTVIPATKGRDKALHLLPKRKLSNFCTNVLFHIS